MKRFHYKLICLLTVWVVLLPVAKGQSEQQLSFTLLDAKTQQPVEDAFVFYSGSSTGEISDKNGQVTLPYEEYLELVISHLNYQTKVLPAASLRAKMKTILLQPQGIRLEEVTVTDSQSAKRKNWMKRFEGAFLGGRRDRKQVQILNPEVILFSETAFGLKAEANAPIRIYNEALGYDLRFFLSNFLLNKKGETVYSGRAYFEKLSTEQKGLSADWEERRQEYFRSSKRYFFSKLAREGIDDEQYTIGSSTLKENLDFVGFQEVTPKSLQWKKGPKADTLLFTGFFTVLDRKIVTKYGMKSVYQATTDEYATSLLRSRSGQFIISPTGILLNNKEIEELGYWADQRVARLLPTDYQFKGIADMPELINQLENGLSEKEAIWASEGLYVQTDKPYYSLNDELWFRVYLIDKNLPTRRPPSKIIRVELIDPVGNIVQSLLLHEDQSPGGAFSLKAQKEEGIYHLRAYTNYMRGEGEQSFFQQAIPVLAPTRSVHQQLKGVQLSGGQKPQAKVSAASATALRVEPQEDRIKAKQSIALEISFADSLLAAGATVSLSVTDRKTVVRDESATNILSYFGGEEGNTEAIRVASADTAATYLPESTASLSGYLSRKGKPDQRVKGEVLLTALHPQPVIKKVVTDEEGKFLFEDLPYLDTVTYILQAAVLNAQQVLEGPMLSSKDRRVDIHLEEKAPAEIRHNGMANWGEDVLPAHLLGDFLQLAFKKAQQDTSQRSAWEIDLDAITVRGRKATDSRNQNVYDLNRLDWVEPRQPASQLLSTLKPGYRFLRDIETNSMIAHVINSTGRMIIQPVSININGVPANLLQFERLRAEMIDYISITRTSIIIKTRAAPRPAAAAEGEGMLVYQDAGFYPGRVFPAPNYGLEQASSSQRDLRTTIHWEPNVRVEAGKKTIIRFYAAGTATTYDVIVEGITDVGEPIYERVTLKVLE